MLLTAKAALEHPQDVLITVSSLSLPPIFLLQGDGAGHRVSALSLGSMVRIPNVAEAGVARGLV